MPIHGNDTVRIFVDHYPMWIHAKCAHPVLKLFRAVNNLALVQFIRQMGEDYRRKLYPDSDVHPVGLGLNVHLPAHFLHPFAAAASY